MSDERLEKLGKRYLRLRIGVLTGVKFFEYVNNQHAIERRLSARLILKARRVIAQDRAWCAA